MNGKIRTTNTLQVYICSRSIYYMKQKINQAFLIVLMCMPFVDIQAQFIADSLGTRLAQKDLLPEERVTTMALLARAKSITDIKSAMRIAEKALSLSRQLPDAKYQALVYTHLVFLHFVNEEVPLAQKAVDSAIWYADKTSDKRIKGFALFRKGWLLDIQGNDHEAMATFLQALKYLEGTGAYIYQSLKTARQSGDAENLAFAYHGMASFYLNVYIHAPL